MPTNVLIIDDSVAARQALVGALSAKPDIHALPPAADGRSGLRRIVEGGVDLVVLDVEMPGMDGLETLREIRKAAPKLPVVMFSATTERGAVNTIEALSLGAADYLAKPSTRGGETRTLDDVTGDLVEIIRALVGAKAKAAVPSRVAPKRPTGPRGPVELVVVGSSTGGPNALAKVLGGLPRTFDAPLIVCQHMPAEFTHQLAARLDRECAFRVSEAKDGQRLLPGEVCVARGGVHLVVERRIEGLTLRFDNRPRVHSCKPAVDVLFESAAKAYGRELLGVVLTGMGQDGLEGCRAIAESGGEVMVQDRQTSAVWGMPGVVANAGLADQVLPIDRIAGAIERSAVERRRSKVGRS